MNDRWITSIGIDVGTSTTKCILSRLRIARVSGDFTLPRYEIAERRLVYASPISFTPLLSEDVIDAASIGSLLQKEYEHAGVLPEEIQSGAVIITGETATRTNAERVVHLLASQAGKFVVAAAGADLEGVMAGKGAGAERRSHTIRGIVANVDIGGGTSNIALFYKGNAVVTVTFHVGGRMIRIDKKGLIEYISPRLIGWLELNRLSVAPGMEASMSLLTSIASGLGRDMLSYLQGNRNEGAELLGYGPLPAKLPAIEEIMYSGGVARLMRESRPERLGEVTKYGDLGPLLAHCLASESRRFAWRHVPAEQTVRATVIGAGMQSTELSGSTVYADAGALPVRNVPVLKTILSRDDDWSEAIRERFDTGGKLYSTAGPAPFALAISCRMSVLSYRELRQLAEEIITNVNKVFIPEQTVVIVCDKDMAKALGHLLALHCRGKPKVVCIDQVRLEHGDYVDIGEMIADRVVPVIVKTLVFPNKETGVMA